MDSEGVLSPELIIAAYRGGYFPMPDPGSGEILWYNPDPRAVIPLNGFHISRSLRKTAQKRGYKISFDRAFSEVISACANRPSTWISPAIQAVYTRLFELGYAHSIEVWSSGNELVGGLYGVSQGGVFNAESMFSTRPDTSKMALWALVQRMKECNMALLEVQFMTEHLRRLGAVNIRKSQYIHILNESLAEGGPFEPSTTDYKLY